ncbi:MAG: NAD(P)/FAD-dependent oxidoreductase, partial [Malacoplasma sp.]|nr:NAD(P)/FAD-dependent oxidoreductase [Malacoplasma sp.]
NLYFLFETNQEEFLAEKIIIATGNGTFNPRKLEINNQEIISKLINYSIDLNASVYKNKKIIVLGGGDSAVEWANYFVEENITKDVTIVHRRNKYRSSLFMIDSLEKNKIVQKLNYEIVAFDEANKSITISHNENNQKEILNFDCLIVQYGQIANPINIKILNDLEKEKGKYKIDINQKTSHKNIYAIGDATHYNCKPNTIITACADATKAVWHIAKNKYESN